LNEEDYPDLIFIPPCLEIDFFSLKQGRKFEPELFITDITTITAEFWEKAVPLMPEEWEWEHWPAVSEYIMNIVEHAEDFVTNAMSTLQ
jgi:hypothetical protein